MSTLLERIARASAAEPPDNIGGHLFEAALELYLNGHIPQSAVVSQFTLTASQETELAWFKTHFDGLGTALAKIAYFHDVIACVTALQAGEMSEATFRSILGLPA